MAATETTPGEMALRSEIVPHLVKIEELLERYLPDWQYKVTLVARYTGGDREDADIILTQDTKPGEIGAVILRLFPTGENPPSRLE